MVVEQAPRVEPYGFQSAFEEQVVFLMASDEDFYRRVGFLVEPDALENKSAREFARTVHLLFDEAIQAKQKKPGKISPFDRRKIKIALDPLYVVQRLNQLSRDGGRIPREVVNDVQDFVERITDKYDLDIDDEMVILLLVPELKRRLQTQAISTAIVSHRDRKEFNEVQALLEEAANLGVATMQIGAGNLTLHGDDTYAAIEALQRRVRMPLGIPEIDRELSGGVPESSLFCVMAVPGGGKSILLEHALTETILSGQGGLYATLEVEPEIVTARVISNITGIPIDELHGPKLQRARDIMAEIAPHLGNFEVEMFEAEVTRVQHIKEWAHRKEDEYGCEFPTIVIDYADYLTAGDNNQHSYQAMKFIYRAMFAWAHKEKKRILTASATKEKKDKKGTTTMDEASDSRYKARIVDMMAAIDVCPDGLMISIIKNRAGKSGSTIGPHPNDFARGRLIATNRGEIHAYMAEARRRVERFYAAMDPGRMVSNAPAIEAAVVAAVESPKRPVIHSLEDW